MYLWAIFLRENLMLFPPYLSKGQLNSKRTYENIVYPKMQTKKFPDFYPTKRTSRDAAGFLNPGWLAVMCRA